MSRRNRKDKVKDSEADVTSVSESGVFDDVTDNGSTYDDISLDSFSSKTVVFEQIVTDGEKKEESTKSGKKKNIPNPFKSIGENLKKNLRESKNSKASVRESISEDFDSDNTEEEALSGVSDEACIDEAAKVTSDKSGEEVESTHRHHHHHHHSHSDTSKGEEEKSDSESSHHHHHSHSSTSKGENEKSDSESGHHHHHSHSSTSESENKKSDRKSRRSRHRKSKNENKDESKSESEISEDESLAESESSAENESIAESSISESQIVSGNESIAENNTAESRIAENESVVENDTTESENVGKDSDSKSDRQHHRHHSRKNESDNEKSDSEKSSHSHHHSSSSKSESKSESSHHHSSSSSNGESKSNSDNKSSHHHHSSESGSSSHHHHHHHHSSKESDHEYEVSYGKYNFSVNPDEEDVPVAKYRKISKRKQEQEKKKKELEKKKKPKSKAFIIFMRIGITVVSILLVIVISLVVMIVMGKNSLLEDNQNVRVKLPASVEMYDDYIIYKGHKYKYNENVATVLFSGIDKKTKEHNEEIFGTAGQADSIFVLALDTSTGSYKLMALSRDSMVDVNICDAAGNFKGTQKMQICLAHAYGDGEETSNLNLKRSISRLFFGIPVNAYMSVDLDIIPILNDDVGGVTVTVIEDLTNWNPIFKKGETITLHGTQAETYVRARDVTGDENQNNLRMDRQKSYIDGFVDNAITMTRKDFSTPLMLYNDVADYSRTDIDATKISYLASVFLQRGFSSDEDLVKIPGKTVMGEKYAEYHVDTEAFFDIIIQAYYIRID